MLSLRLISYLFVPMVLLNFFAATIDVVQAYYHPGDNTENMQFGRERNNAGADKPAEAFVLYDNSGYPSTATTSHHVITTGSENFVPAEVIDCNIPIHIAIRHPIVAENDLANLLYADLKLKKLYDEYKSLQKRTKEILAGLSVPFVDQGQTSGRQTNNAPSVYEKRKEIEQEHEVAIRFTKLAGSRRENINNLSLGGSDSLTTLVRREGNSNLMRIESPNLQPLEEKVENKDSGVYRAGQQAEGTPPGSSVKGKNNKSLIPDKTGVPWIFRMFMKVQDYMFSNPRELIITLLTLALLLSFLLSGRRR